MIDMNDDTTAMLIILPPAGLFFLALLVGLVLVVRDTVRRKGGWGINTKPVFCPCCGDPAPHARIPKTWREALWGGINCPNCGLAYDKWGKAVSEVDLRIRLGEFDNNSEARPRPRQRNKQQDDRVESPGKITKEYPHET